MSGPSLPHREVKHTMPKSKRQKVVKLTVVQKKGSEWKNTLVDRLRELATNDKFRYIYVIDCENPRSECLRFLRQSWAPSRFFLAKQKIMKLALGENSGDEILPNICQLTQHLNAANKRSSGSHQVGLFFSHEEIDPTIKWFHDYNVPQYARNGFRSPVSVRVPKGVVPHWTFSYEPHLRQMGLPFQVVEGKIELTQELEVCKKGDVLNRSQCKVLELLEQPLAKFRVKVLAVYDKNNNSVLEVKNTDNDGDEEGMVNGSAAAASAV